MNRKLKIVYIKEILESAYLDYKKSKSGWGMTFYRRVNQIGGGPNEGKENFIKFSLGSNFKKYIDYTCSNMISKEIDVIMAFRRYSPKSEIISEANKFKSEAYGIVYTIIRKILKKIVGNEWNYYEILFKSKDDLQNKVDIIFNDMKISHEKKRKTVIQVWNKTKCL